MNDQQQQWPATDDYDEFTGWCTDFSLALVILVASLLIGSASGLAVWISLNLAR